MILKKKTLKKNPSNRKPISYSTEFRLDINLNNLVGRGRGGEVGMWEGGKVGRGAKVIHTYRHTNMTKRVKEELSLRKIYIELLLSSHYISWKGVWG